MSKTLTKKKPVLRKQVSYVLSADTDKTVEEIVKDVQRLLGDKYRLLTITASVTVDGKVYSESDIDWTKHAPKPDAVAYGEQRTRNAATLDPAVSGYKGMDFSSQERKKPLVRTYAGPEPKARPASTRTASTVPTGTKKLLRKQDKVDIPPPKVSMEEIDDAAATSSVSNTDAVKRRLIKRR